jgi:hypothetical protein
MGQRRRSMCRSGTHFHHLNGPSAGIKAEVLRLEQEAGNLVRLLATGQESIAIRNELRALETALQGLRVELADLVNAFRIAPPVHRAWAMGKFERIRATEARSRSRQS